MQERDSSISSEQLWQMVISAADGAVLERIETHGIAGAGHELLVQRYRWYLLSPYIGGRRQRLDLATLRAELPEVDAAPFVTSLGELLVLVMCGLTTAISLHYFGGSECHFKRVGSHWQTSSGKQSEGAEDGA